MPQVLVRHLTPRDLAGPTLTDRLLSPLLQNKIGRFAKSLFHYVCVLIPSPQPAHCILITYTLYNRGAQTMCSIQERVPIVTQHVSLLTE